MVIDTHLSIDFKSEQNKNKLLGFSLQEVKENQNYSPDYFVNFNLQNNTPIIDINDELSWLEKELSISQSQVKQNISELSQNMG
jgi:hypothetical protein